MRTLVTVLCCLSLLPPLAGCGGAAPEAAEPKAVWEDPDHDPYNFYRSVALTLLRTQQYMRASRPIRKMRKLRTSDPEPPYLLASVHIGLKEFALAKQSLEQAMELDENYAPAVSAMGALLNMMGQHKKAHAFHKRAIEIAPDNAGYHNNLGFSLYLAGDYKGAVVAYKDALQEDSGAKRVHNNLGFAYGKLGDMDAAHKHFLLAGPAAQASNNVAFVYEESGNLPRAYDFYVISIHEDPGLIQARLNLERVCERLGRDLPELPEPPQPAPPALPPPEGDVLVQVQAMPVEATPPPSPSPEVQP
jgi:Flp pilus assembly protein TadD